MAEELTLGILTLSTSVLSTWFQHAIIVVDSDIKPTHVKTPPCKIYRFHKTDWPSIKEATNSFASSFAELALLHTVEENWNCFKEHMKIDARELCTIPIYITAQKSTLLQL